MIKPIAVFLLAALAVAVLLALQPSPCFAGPLISYPTFSSTAGVTLNGAPLPTQVGSTLQMTQGHGNVASAFVSVPQDVAHDFHAVYQFTITNPHSPIAANGADGLAFVVQADPRGANAFGIGGNGVGYSDDVGSPPEGQAIINSVAVVLRTYTYNVFQVNVNPAPGDVNYQLAAGALATQVGNVPNLINQLETVTVDYSHGDDSLSVRFNGNSIGLDHVLLPESLSSILGSNVGYFGFTAGTGADWSTISVNSFSVVPEPSSLALAAIGLVSFAAWEWRRRKRLAA